MGVGGINLQIMNPRWPPIVPTKNVYEAAARLLPEGSQNKIKQDKKYLSKTFLSRRTHYPPLIRVKLYRGCRIANIFPRHATRQEYANDTSRKLKNVWNAMTRIRTI